MTRTYTDYEFNLEKKRNSYRLFGARMDGSLLFFLNFFSQNDGRLFVDSGYRFTSIVFFLRVMFFSPKHLLSQVLLSAKSLSLVPCVDCSFSTFLTSLLCPWARI